MTIDPKLDLILERTVETSPAKVWAAWTQPEHVKKWFCPAPWTTVGCEIDLRPGGRFFTVMRSPEGQEFPNDGCYLEVVPEKKLVFTSAMAAGYRPVKTDLPFTAMILLEPHNGGTRYTAIVLHGDEENRAKHEAMGFHGGWSAALDQLVAYMR
jgi:uncharacterized protein YndB with AHSA1/START domain